MTNHTCGRCGIADARVLDLDTGGAYHPEPRHCIELLRERLAEIQKSEVIAYKCHRPWLSDDTAVYLRAGADDEQNALAGFTSAGYLIMPLVAQVGEQP